MAKTDIKYAFRIIPIHPTDFESLGMKWDNLYYHDQALPMGVERAVAYLNRLAPPLSG